jgi:hypothetical protein
VKQLTPWQKKESEVRVMDNNLKIRVFKLQNLHKQFIDMLLDGMSEQQIKDELQITDDDIRNFYSSYRDGYLKEYLQLRLDAKGYHDVIDVNAVYMILAQAAVGEREMTSSQEKAIKLLMQAKGMIAVNGGKKKEKEGKVSGFVMEEDDGKGV